jgi:hypothetical protein
VEIACIIDNFRNDIIQNVIRTLFGDKIKKDMTVRNRSMRLLINENDINIHFISWEQEDQSFAGLRPSIIICHGTPPENYTAWMASNRLYGALVLTV